MSDRVEWNSNITFLLAMIGAAVGLGNIWKKKCAAVVRSIRNVRIKSTRIL